MHLHLLSVYHLLEMKLTLSCYNGQLVAQVIVDQVTDALKQHVFSAYLKITKKQNKNLIFSSLKIVTLVYNNLCRRKFVQVALFHKHNEL